MSEYGGDGIITFPAQQLPYSKKNNKWRKSILDWAESKSYINYSPVRKTMIHKQINYDLLNGKIHMQDLSLILNPEGINAPFIPENIQHYPIMNSKLNVLRGEESKRIFDFRVVITNQNAISEAENRKKEELFSRVKDLVSNAAVSEEQFNQELQKVNDYYIYEYQDFREIRANALLNHYIKEYNIPLMFNAGFTDALAVGEEIYQCDIIGGEPVIQKLNPLKVRVFKSGYSNNIEDADIIIIEDYWSQGKIIDTYYDALKESDIKKIENYFSKDTDGFNNVDERRGITPVSEITEGSVIDSDDDNIDLECLFTNSRDTDNMLPYDMFGNIRVIKMYWKSRRKIKKIKYYNQETGEEDFSFYPEDYIPDKAKGEEEEIFYINEAWEGTKIGKDIYVNIRPRPIQYNRLSNPSRCHFGIVGSIYNLNDDKPFSLVDMMKPYNYLYDVIHDRLNKTIARNWGKLLDLDLAKVPKGWDINKWIYYAKVNGIIVTDSFKEGNYGAATGKLAGGLNNASRGVVDAEFGNSIQSYINLLEFIKMEMSEVSGITRQREGQISNRETVGGIERATVQSAHITEWYFYRHEDTKKRALECFLETAKIALRGRSKKFQYILSDFSQQIVDIDGDEFAEADYGLVVDNSNGSQQLNQKLDMLAQAALQNSTLSFSTIMKLYNSNALSEKQRFVEKDEKEIQERNANAQKEQLQERQQEIQSQMQMKEVELKQKEQENIRDNETKILVAQIQQQSQMMAKEESSSDDGNSAELEEKIREFNKKMDLENDKLKWEKEKHAKEMQVKEMQVRERQISRDDRKG